MRVSEPEMVQKYHIDSRWNSEMYIVDYEGKSAVLFKHLNWRKEAAQDMVYRVRLRQPQTPLFVERASSSMAPCSC